jgi:vancomycin resistance protein YoaR
VATVRESPARERIRRARRPRGRLVVAAILCVTAVAGVVALLGRPYRDALPPDTRVGGIDVGGRSDAAAAQLLSASARPVIARGMVLTSGSDRFPVSLTRIRIAPDTAEALRRARDVSFVQRVRDRLGFGESRNLDLRYRFDEQALTRALRPARRAVEVTPVEAGVRVGQNGALKVVRGKGGILIDRPALAGALQQLPRLDGRLELPLRRVQPSADDASAQRALAAATTLLETPHEVVLLGHGYPIRRDALAKALDFAPDGGEVRLKLTRPAIRAEMHRLFGPAEVQPRNARFAVGSTGGVEIVDSSVGREVDADTVRQALEQNPSMEQIPVRIADIKPSFSTADAKKLGITDLVGEFTTPYDPGAPRVTNIQRAAEVLDGFILGPGETFSLNAVLGPRTIENGYVLAPQIEEGKLKDAVGGGVSQVATTLYNAAFMSGLRLVAHTPHEFWISRYPRGREATVSWGGPELVFANDWDAPLVMLLDAGDSSITVRFFSRGLKRRVEYGSDDPTDFKDPATRKVVDTTLQPGEQRVLQQSGSPGFTISYWRKVYKGQDLVANETFTTHYKPEDEILEVGPQPPKPPKPTGTTQAPGTTGGGTGGTTTGGGKDQSPGGQDQPPAGSTASAATQ